MSKPRSTSKPFEISKWTVWEAYRKVRANQGAAGVDEQSIAAFEVNLQDNLYKVWNRMCSGTYFPPPVRAVEIPKRDGSGPRVLGVPTVADRVAQTVVAMTLEPDVEPMFHPDSYGYRPNRSALDAVARCRERCWRNDWVIDLDIRAFFDSIDHDLLLKAVSRHTDQRWVLLYVQRWLSAPLQRADGSLVARDRGTPQGSAISPLLANVFLHYAFDAWMAREFPAIGFERYADDAVVHCTSERQARYVLAAITKRMAQVGLELHPAKTRIVYCKDSNRRGQYPDCRFDFLGYTFRPRKAMNRNGVMFTNFAPAVSGNAAKAIRQTIRGWRLHLRSGHTLAELARVINPIVRGWINYYGRFYRSELIETLNHIDRYLARWARRKFKRLRRHHRRTWRFLARIAQREPNLFVHWAAGARPSAG